MGEWFCIQTQVAHKCSPVHQSAAAACLCHLSAAYWPVSTRQTVSDKLWWALIACIVCRGTGLHQIKCTHAPIDRLSLSVSPCCPRCLSILQTEQKNSGRYRPKVTARGWASWVWTGFNSAEASTLSTKWDIKGSSATGLSPHHISANPRPVSWGCTARTVQTNLWKSEQKGVCFSLSPGTVFLITHDIPQTSLNLQRKYLFNKR